MRFKISLSIDLVNGEKSITMPRSPYLYTCIVYMYIKVQKVYLQQPSLGEAIPVPAQARHAYIYAKHVHVVAYVHVHEESDIYSLILAYTLSCNTCYSCHAYIHFVYSYTRRKPVYNVY